MANKAERKGYPIDVGYIGIVNGKEMLFETEDAYNEYMDDYDDDIERGYTPEELTTFKPLTGRYPWGTKK